MISRCTSCIPKKYDVFPSLLYTRLTCSYCSRRVLVTFPPSRLWLEQCFGLVLVRSKNLTSCLLVAKVYTCSRQPIGLVRFGYIFRFQSSALVFGSCYLLSHSDIVLSFAKSWLWYVIVFFEILAASIIKVKRGVLPTPFWQWASMEDKQFFIMHHG